MKKVVGIILICILAISLYGCKKQTTPNNVDNNQNGSTVDDKTNGTGDEVDDEVDDEVQADKIQDYYPFADDKVYTYAGEGNEYASYIVYTEYMEGNKAQFRTSNGGTEVVKVLEHQDGQLVIHFAEEETYYRENMLNRGPDAEQDILLKGPLVKGTEWTLSDGRKRYISNVDIDVTIPLGDYKALEVTTEGENDVIKDYYAEGIGLIKSVFTSNEVEGYEVTSTLSKIDEKTPLTQQVRFFFPDIAADKNYYITKELSFHTNDITKKVFEDSFKDYSQENFNEVIGKNVKIKSLYLNKDNKVYVDFSKEFTSEMNAGSGYEAAILQCITNTFGEYYGKTQVYITVEGEPYSGGHIAMEKGEAFEVNVEGYEELR